MRLLHTADWHLGKKIESRDRLAEQEAAINELCLMARDAKADAVLVCGDVFDTYTPPAAAEDLFYDALCRLSDNGSRLVLVLAGNHDDGLRLAAAAPIAERQGIVLCGGTAGIPVRAYKGFSVTGTEGGAFSAAFASGAEAVFNALPYPTEARFSAFDKDSSYTQKVAACLAPGNALFRKNTVNVTATHLYADGASVAGGEREIQLGGLKSCALSAFSPLTAYTALGHIHRKQDLGGNAWYSGSLLQYAADEPYEKCALLAELSPGKPAAVQPLSHAAGKRVSARTVSCAAEGTKLLESEQGYLYLTVRQDKPLTVQESRELRAFPALIGLSFEAAQAAGDAPALVSRRTLSPRRIFEEYYKKVYGGVPETALSDLFMEILGEEE